MNKFYQGVAEKIPLKQQKLLFAIPGVSQALKKKIKNGLGLGKANIVATGAAITPAYLKKWYKKLGIHLIEAYGMTEVCGAIVYGTDVNTPFDSVGKVVTGSEIKIDAESGEILMKTPYMMKGYYKDPELTNKVLIDGWLHTGDQGEFDANGFLKITGRISDAFKTTKGKYITPVAIEENIGQHILIEQVCIAGLGIPQPIALINLTEMAIATENSEVELQLSQLLENLNASLSNYEKVSTIIIDTNLWTPENTLVTPTLKIRRKAINQKHQDNYMSWHNDERKIIWI